MESAERRLQLLEEQGALWRKYYEDEERRIEEEYQRSLEEIEATFRKAAKAIELEFSARKEEIKRQFSDESASDKLNSESNAGPSKPLSGCTTSPPVAGSTQKPTAIIKSKFVLNRSSVAVNISREVVRAHNKEDENDEMHGIVLWYCSTNWQCVITSSIRQSTISHFCQYKCETYAGLVQYEFCDGEKIIKLIIASLFLIHDPGGTITRKRPMRLCYTLVHANLTECWFY